MTTQTEMLSTSEASVATEKKAASREQLLAKQLESIDALIFDDFMGKNSYLYLKSNAQMLYDYLKVFWKGGPALENAFCEYLESIREKAILRLLCKSAMLAKKGDQDWRSGVQLASGALCVDIGIDYRMPDSKYSWFSAACDKIQAVYDKAVAEKKKR